MKAIYYDGSIEGMSDRARAVRAAIPASEGHVRMRDAHAWAQQPQQGIEQFDSVLIPTAADFDALAELYANAGAEVFREDLVPAPQEQQAPAFPELPEIPEQPAAPADAPAPATTEQPAAAAPATAPKTKGKAA